MLSAGQLLQKFGVRGKTEIGEGKNMKIESIVRRKQPGRKMQGIAAALLPFEANGRVAVEAFQNHLGATHRAGLMNAVNMDTGYVNFLSEEEKRDVLRWAREALGAGVPFVAGANGTPAPSASRAHRSTSRFSSSLRKFTYPVSMFTAFIRPARCVAPRWF